MIYGIGTDVVEVARIAQKVYERPGFVELVFSESERQYCQKQPNPPENFAARFAAKEAFLKALGTGMEATFELHQIEIVHLSHGAPSLQLSPALTQFVQEKTQGKPYRIHVSLSHTKMIATAYVVLEVF